ncbi:RidA family protein [Sneathiella marina]|uniref:RidA family protein n=1 Tax=Sneathiella marina TaxID=2950108 RepID=A0ABY4W5D8_9PROT|nr:RidA family protein [Sneathiella marina]USG62406.1 RidA family protein [Sneathiella marina]
MKSREINSEHAPVAAGGYAQAREVIDGNRTLYISGQIPVTVDGKIPVSFDDQAQVAWDNIKAQLSAANMDIDNLVKVTTFLSDRKYALLNRRARATALGEHKPALTVIIAGIFDTSWLLEIEAIAVA